MRYMGELIQNCIHLPDNLNDIYINELRLKLRRIVESVMAGDLPAGKVEITIKDEIESSCRYLSELELCFKAYEKSDNTPIGKDIKVLNYCNYSAGFRLVRVTVM